MVMCFDRNMFDQMNNDAIRMILEAQVEANRLAQGFVDTEHILLGMIALPEISTSKLMAAFNVRMPEARLKAEEISGIGTWETKDQISLPLTRLSEQVIDQSWQTAKSFGQINIYPEHILLKLLVEKRGNANRILEGLVANTAALREKCELLCKESGERVTEKTSESPKLTDIEQRKVFYRSFPKELKNIMRYSLGKDDGFTMFTHIVGKVMGVSRCLLVCKLPGQQSFQHYEYCRPSEQSCKELQWPGSDSLLVSRMRQDKAVTFHDEDEQLEASLRDELRLITTKSFFGLSLDVESKIYGFLILQQCDRHRVLDDNDVAFLLDIAKVVAQAIAT
jgi:hypothetical protein